VGRAFLLFIDKRCVINVAYRTEYTHVHYKNFIAFFIKALYERDENN